MNRRIFVVLVACLAGSISGALAGSEVSSFAVPLLETLGGLHQSSYAMGALLYASGTNTLGVRSPIFSDNALFVVRNSASGDVGWDTPTVTNTALYGDGSDGTVTYDGSTTILGMAPSANVYTLTRDVTFVSCTVNSGVTVITGGFRMFGTNTLTNRGTIQNNGNDGGAASGSTAGSNGAPTTAGTLGSGGIGGVGGAVNALGNAPAINPGNPSCGGDGGHGGQGGLNGGANGTVVAPSSSLNTRRSYPGCLTGKTLSGASFTSYSGGAGGGGGGGAATTNAGGGGGGGGGVVLIAFKVIDNSSTGVISANGGAGGNGVAGTVSGMGGAGGGGYVMYVYNSFSGNTPTASAGTNGTVGGTTGRTNASAGTVLGVSNNQ